MSEPFVLGFEEWLALPGLGLPAIRAKVDTGAKTSALSAHLIERFGPVLAPMVRFLVHPVPGRPDIEIACVAALVDERWVASSNGGREARHVIATEVEMGGRRWPIEVTLTGRDTMTYRMLLGRQAIPPGALVDPGSGGRQPALGYHHYDLTDRRAPDLRAPAPVRPLAIAVLTGAATDASVALVEAAAALAGHRIEVVESAALGVIEGRDGIGITLRGAALPVVDAVVCLSGAASAIERAALRQLEYAGAWALDGADQIGRLADPIAVAQVLARARLPASLADSMAEFLAVVGADGTTGTCLSILVIGARAIAILETAGGQTRARRGRKLGPERKLARRSAQALGLRLAVIDISQGATDRGPQVIGVRAVPDLARIGALAGVDVGRALLAEIEATLYGRGRRVSG